MDEKSDFQDLMQKIHEGSEEAAWQLVARHGDAVRRAVRRALDARLRPKFDSLDFVQLVWSSFFRVRDQVDRFNRPEELVAFLIKMTQNKVGMEFRRRLCTEKYNIQRERPLEEITATEYEELSKTQHPPDEMAIARERWDRILEGQPDHYREIVRLKLQGHSCQEIAQSLRLAESTVRRFLRKLSDEWQGGLQ